MCPFVLYKLKTDMPIIWDPLVKHSNCLLMDETQVRLTDRKEQEFTAVSNLVACYNNHPLTLHVNSAWFYPSIMCCTEGFTGTK